jgi:hypothetical protein
MPWFLTGHGSSCLEEHQERAHRQMKLKLFTYSRQVCTSYHFIGQPTSLKTGYIQNPKPDLNAVKPGEKTARRVPKKDDNGFERQLSETLATQTERDQCLAQLPVTEELTLKSALLEAEANAAEKNEACGTGSTRIR